MQWFLLVILSLLLHAAQAEAATSFGQKFSLVSSSQAKSAVTLGKGISNAGEDDSLLAIDKNLLGVPFLFLPTAVTDSTAAGFPVSLGAKRVSFAKRGNSLFLMEQMEGRSIPDPFRPEKIVAEFPIVRESADQITFDLRRGFDNLVVQLPAYFQDWADLDLLVPVSASYLRDPIVEENLFGISHVVQIASSFPVTVTLTYGFIPDRTPRFEPIRKPEKQQVGFFVTHPTYDKGVFTAKQFISRWDLQRPIAFHISSNTPVEFREAVRDGIEAWNEAFGRRVVIAKDAPEGVMIGDPRYNIVQWVGIEQLPGAFAYADWHVHPLSGEILHANVVFLSSWAVIFKEDAERLLRYLESKQSDVPLAFPGEPTKTEKSPLASAEPRRFGLRGFEPISLCNDFGPDTFYETFLRRIVAGDIPEAKILPLMQRIVKTVIMHEIGHDLGLRHNFAGSLGTQLPPASDQDDVAALLLHGSRLFDDFLPTASVMDYLTLYDDLRMERPGDYDRAAIRWGYRASTAERESMWIPPYCTDDDVGTDADCERWDAWSDPLEWRIAYAPLEVNVVSADLLRELDAETREPRKKLRKLPWLRHVWGMSNYASSDVNVRPLNGKPPEVRRRRAGEGLRPYLWSDAGSAAPLGVLAMPELIARRSELVRSAEQGDKEATVKLAWLTRELQSMRDRTVSIILGRLRSSGVQHPSNAASEGLSPDALEAMLPGLVGLAGNAGFAAWFADVNDYRIEAVLLFAWEEGAAFEQAKSQLQAKLVQNIAQLQRLLATVNDEKQQREVSEQLEFETFLLSLIDLRYQRKVSR